jgi:hypothetical protein
MTPFQSRLKEMKDSVAVQTLGFRDYYSKEFIRDVKSIYGDNAEAELIATLSDEILTDVNVEISRVIREMAKEMLAD